LTERAIAAAKQIAALASSRGLAQSQLAIAWVKEQPGVVAPIIGPRTENQLDDALAVADLKIDQDLASALDEIVPPGSAVANFHNNSGWMKMKVS
jgi:aryl-alcohol dehydrogenase-like predicted oxidoreductase